MLNVDTFKVKGVQVVNIKNNSEVAMFGIATLCGSNFETPGVSGISHFIEHMFFKGTTKRTWGDIATDLSMLGVSPNAYTTNTEVFYHSTFPKENIEGVIEVTLDMFFNSTFPEDELEKERGVIVEERKAYDDNPNASFNMQVLEHFAKWDKGHATIGELSTINSIQRLDMLKYLDEHINLSNFIFICCGDVNSEDLKRFIEQNTPDSHSFLEKGTENTLPLGLWKEMPKNDNIIKFTVERENISQAQIMMFMEGISAWDDQYEAANILYKAIGGGVYSKLFTKIREELGLCYTVGMYGYALDYPHVTGIDLYGGLATENIDLFIEESEKIIADVVKNGISKELFDCAKIDMLSSLLKVTETSYGKGRYYLKKFLRGNLDKEDSIDKVRKVTLEDCNSVIPRIFNKDNEHRWCVMIPKETK